MSVIRAQMHQPLHLAVDERRGALFTLPHAIAAFFVKVLGAS
jgi:hypothetical protein